jgi:hypothetical protein
MPNFAVLNEANDVTNVIVADTKEIAEDVTGFTCVPCESTKFVGATWNGTEFILPEPVVTEPPTE